VCVQKRQTAGTVCPTAAGRIGVLCMFLRSGIKREARGDFHSLHDDFNPWSMNGICTVDHWSLQYVSLKQGPVFMRQAREFLFGCETE
jgi:hypothetical protein